jgi:hypothetical protein
MYREPPNNDLLGQGDILNPESLRSILKGHQDYFADQPYFRRYMVLTQTCDLVRKREMADFIFLAVIRKLDDVFGRRHVEDGPAQNRTFDLLRELYNHQPNKRGLFYLPENARYGIEEESVADLRVMFSVHKAIYPRLLRARCGAITDIYAAQLGQIAGHMFNRIAIPEWDEISPEVKLQDRVKIVRQSIIDREQEVFLGLKKKEDACFFDNCNESVSTYRWLSVRLENNRQIFEPHLLCKTHAKFYEEIRGGREPGKSQGT